MDDRNANRCVQTEMLNKYLDGQDRDARMLESFESDVEPHLLVIEEAISRMKEIAKGYESYDFRYTIDEMIKERCNV